MDEEFLSLKRWLEETAQEPLETMAGFFDRRIGDYEAHMSPWREHYRWMAQQIPEDAETLLDIGCGTGLELDEIFKRLPELSVTGVDLSEEMLKKLREKHPDRKLTLLREDYFRWEPGEERFDVVISFETLHHFPMEKKAELFAKLHRCLKPGGVYLECDYIASNQAIEDLCVEECRRRRQRDGIGEETFVHFDTPLTLEHELQAIHAGGFREAEVLGFPPGDNHTPLIRARKK